MASLSVINTMSFSLGNTQTNQLCFPELNSLPLGQSDKWTYLIADNIQLNQDIEYTIKLKRPDNDTVFEWLEKIVCGGQCSTIFVEQLDLNDSRFRHIKFLCKMYKVILVNLTTQENLPDNVVFGPWS